MTVPFLEQNRFLLCNVLSIFVKITYTGDIHDLVICVIFENYNRKFKLYQ